jgi:hypothetical protein
MSEIVLLIFSASAIAMPPSGPSLNDSLQTRHIAVTNFQSVTRGNKMQTSKWR